MKYICHNISVSEISRYKNMMNSQKQIFSEETNHIPHMELVLVAPDDICEKVVNQVGQLEHWNNFSVNVVRESDLTGY